MSKLGWIAVCSLLISGCVEDGDDGARGPAGPAGPAGQDGSDGADGGKGDKGEDATLPLPAVYTLANAAGPNQVSSYLRASSGNLSRQGSFATGGMGTGGGLGSQGALVYSAAHKRFFAVNPGNDTVSMLALDGAGNLTTLSTIASGGVRPVSVTVRGDLVYVANQGTLGGATVNANISGFKIAGNALTAIAGSTQPLSGTGDVRPTDLELSPDGKFLVVVERFASRLDTFAIVDGVARPGTFQTSAGMQPFAFDFSPEGHLVVAEVGNGSPGGSSVSSYALSATGALTPITSALATHQSAACWLVVAGGYAYVANAASANITGVVIAEDGALTLRDESGVTALTGSGATDLAVAPDRGYLYSLAGNPRAIHIFSISADGGLTAHPALPGVSATAVGLAAR
jgi:6-phosphogluconolactonase (cycloisomerase 2 family)